MRGDELVNPMDCRLRPKIPWIGVSITTPGGAGHFLRERYDAGGHRGESFTKHPGDMRTQSSAAALQKRLTLGIKDSKMNLEDRAPTGVTITFLFEK